VQVRHRRHRHRRQRDRHRSQGVRKPGLPRASPEEGNGASANDAQFKAEQEKRRREEAIANATGLRVLSAISAAVPVRLMKRDLMFLAERMVNLLDENRAAILAKQHGIKKTKENESIGKLFTAFLRRADESTLGRAVVEAVVLLTASRGNASHVLRDAAEFYKVDVAAITATVKQEFAAKEKAKAAKTATPKPAVKAPAKTRRKQRSVDIQSSMYYAEPARPAPHFCVCPLFPPSCVASAFCRCVMLLPPSGQRPACSRIGDYCAWSSLVELRERVFTSL
jgi:hypothetical protein